MTYLQTCADRTGRVFFLGDDPVGCLPLVPKGFWQRMEHTWDTSISWIAWNFRQTKVPDSFRNAFLFQLKGDRKVPSSLTILRDVFIFCLLQFLGFACFCCLFDDPTAMGHEKSENRVWDQLCKFQETIKGLVWYIIYRLYYILIIINSNWIN